MINKKRMFGSVILILAVTASPATATTIRYNYIGPDILKGKYICIVKMQGEVAYQDCDSTYTARKIRKPMNQYILKDKKDPKWFAICETKKLVNCKILAKK